jgi:hypothetical protein
VSGIKMHVLMETKEEKKDDVWTVKERSIIEVYYLESPSIQGRLELRAPLPQNNNTKNSN